MSRRRRIVLPNYIYHLTQRGNYQQWVFDDEVDYKYYCSLVNGYAGKCGLEILAYCLMGNHVHFIIRPINADSIAKMFQTVHMRYAQYFNAKMDKKGHLWQGRFYSCILGESHLTRAMRYVEVNPARAGIVKRGWDYEWSSAKKHVGISNKSYIKLNEEFNIKKVMGDASSWEEYLLKDEELEFLENIRLMTLKGLVLGSDRFVDSLERRLNVSLRINKGGRPRKDKG